MGKVYRAYGTAKDRVVALKRVSPHLAADAETDHGCETRRSGGWGRVPARQFCGLRCALAVPLPAGLWSDCLSHVQS